MKTLDEVIKAMLICKNEDIDRTCKGCPMPDTEMCINELMTDALHYLKAYKDDKDDLTALRAYWAEQQANPALTWDELQQMEGKPVWMEYISCKRKVWAIVDCFYTDAFGKVNMNVALPHDYWHLEKELIGKAWQAYRKGRE